MRKLQVALFAFAATAALATAAHAQSDDTHGYYTVGLQDADFGSSSYGKGLQAINLTGALNVWKFVSVEGDLAIGESAKSNTIAGINVKTKLQNDVAFYADASMATSKDMDIVARLGFLEAKIEAKSSGVAASATASGPAIGVGLHYFPNGGKCGVALDFNHADFGKNNGNANFYKISYVRRF